MSHKNMRKIMFKLVLFLISLNIYSSNCEKIPCEENKEDFQTVAVMKARGRIGKSIIPVDVLSLKGGGSKLQLLNILKAFEGLRGIENGQK